MATVVTLASQVHVAPILYTGLGGRGYNGSTSRGSGHEMVGNPCLPSVMPMNEVVTLWMKLGCHIHNG